MARSNDPVGIELATAIPVALIGALGAALTVFRPTQGGSFSAHQRVDERGQQFVQYIGVGGGE
jgi:hypothetical protein